MIKFSRECRKFFISHVNCLNSGKNRKSKFHFICTLRQKKLVIVSGRNGILFCHCFLKTKRGNLSIYFSKQYLKILKLTYLMSKSFLYNLFFGGLSVN